MNKGELVDSRRRESERHEKGSGRCSNGSPGNHCGSGVER